MGFFRFFSVILASLFAILPSVARADFDATLLDIPGISVISYKHFGTGDICVSVIVGSVPWDHTSGSLLCTVCHDSNGNETLNTCK